MADENNSVELKVTANPENVYKALQETEKAARGFGKTFGDSQKDVGEEIEKQTKRSKTFMQGMRDVGRRAANQLKSDFKALASIEFLQSGLQISNQFKNSISETIDLNTQIRKLGSVFGLATGEFSKFQTSVTKGLGEIGLSSDVATRALQGLATTPVRGEEALLEYTKTAGQLASLSGTTGQEGAIAQGIASTIVAKGGDVNNIDQMNRVAEDLRKAFNVTGQAPTQILKTMQGLFESMPEEFRKSISTSGLVNLSATATQLGPQSTKFLEEFLGKSKIERTALEAQGFEGVFTEQGLDIDKFAKAAEGILTRTKGDPRFAAQTLGLSEDAAEGFVRLARNLDRVREAQAGLINQTGDLTSQYKNARGLGEAFNANINQVKKFLATPISFVTDQTRELFNATAENEATAAATVLGGGALAAVLAGAGLRGIGKTALGGAAGGFLKTKAFEQFTGEEVQEVYVVNASEIAAAGALGGGGGVLDKLGGKNVMTKLGAVAGVGLAGAAGFGAGSLLNERLIETKTQGTTSEGFSGNIVERLFFKLNKIMGGEGAARVQEANQALQAAPGGRTESAGGMGFNRQKIIIENKAAGFKVRPTSRGTNI